MRALTLIFALAAGLLAPAAARAADLQPLGPCYRSVNSETRETVPVRASGFTPGERVNVYIDGGIAKQDVIVLPDGTIEGGVPAPYQVSGQRLFTLTVTEVEKPGNTASVTSQVTALSLRLKPKRAAPARRVRFIGRGFTDGGTVYAHYVRKGRLRKTVDLGPPQGPCGQIDVKRRQIPLKRPALGRWTLQVDNQPIYSSRPPSVFMRLTISVTRVARPAGF